jgi:hypothetical protein
MNSPTLGNMQTKLCLSMLRISVPSFFGLVISEQNALFIVKKSGCASVGEIRGKRIDPRE